MLHRVTVWLSRNRAAVWLWACTVITALAWVGNTIWPAPRHGYLVELALLTAIGIAAVWAHHKNITGAVFLYCACALLPVGFMLEYQQTHGGGWSAFVLTPFVGVLAVTILTRCQKATIIYGFVALVANCATGVIYNDNGQVVPLVGLTVVTVMFAVAWLGCDMQQAHKKLDELRGEASRLNQLEQETRTHDP